MKSLRVLILSPGLKPSMGGAAFSEAALCSTMRKRCELKVLCRKGNIDNEFLKQHEINSIVKEFHPIDFLLAFLFPGHRLSKLWQNIDLVHLNGHWKWENYFVARLCTQYRVPFLVHPRGMFLVGHRKVFLKKLFNFLLGNYIAKKAWKVIALSEFEKTQYQPYPLSKSKVVVLPNGIPQPRTTSPCVREGFIYLGRVEQRKNLDFLIRAYHAYRKRGGAHTLKIIGPSERGCQERLLLLLKQLGLPDLFLPPQFGSQKWETMRNAKALIYPAREEAYGRVPFEAIAAGALAVVPRQSGAAEYIRPFLPQCIYATEDIESMATLLLQIESLNLEEAMTSAQRWIREHLDWDTIGLRLHHLYLEAPKLRRVTPQELTVETSL